MNDLTIEESVFYSLLLNMSNTLTCRVQDKYYTYIRISNYCINRNVKLGKKKIRKLINSLEAKGYIRFLNWRNNNETARYVCFLETDTDNYNIDIYYKFLKYEKSLMKPLFRAAVYSYIVYDINMNGSDNFSFDDFYSYFNTEKLSSYFESKILEDLINNSEFISGEECRYTSVAYDIAKKLRFEWMKHQNDAKNDDYDDGEDDAEFYISPEELERNRYMLKENILWGENLFEKGFNWDELSNDQQKSVIDRICDYYNEKVEVAECERLFNASQIHSIL